MVTQRTVRQVRRALLWALTVVLALIAVVVGMSAWRVFGTLAHVRGERIEVEKERDTLVTRIGELKAAVGELGTERGMEKEIRSRYPLVKPGEVEFVFVDKTDESIVDTSTTTRESVWGKLIRGISSVVERVLPKH